jgi:hypothetical protein
VRARGGIAGLLAVIREKVITAIDEMSGATPRRSATAPPGA